MFPALTAPLDDHSEARSRAQSIGVGSRLSLAAIAATLAYSLSTWSSPHRMALLVLIGIAAVWALTPVLVGAERIVRSSRRELLFLIWSFGTVALIGALVAADGGADSPLALLFVMPLAFAALSYPLPSVVAIGAADVLTFVAVGLTGTESSGSRLGFFATCLAITALLCAWEAMDHDRQREALALVSRTDPLTGCLNRRGFEERFEAELDGATRSNGTLGLVMLDLDHFKTVNDTRGHAAGDDLLRWCVQRAGETLRPMDSLGRFGGDEFAILVPGATQAKTREVADRVRSAFAENVAVSVGVACFPADGVDRESLHHRADAGLYAAKDGRAGARDLDFASALAAAVNLRMAVPDEQTSTVPHFALAIADRLGFSDADRAMLRLAATLHDVGKVSVPDRILRKPGPLTNEEFDHVKGHPAAGAEIVAHIDGLTPLADWILHSHEHVDGSGYPHGLTGDAIPLASRVLLVADAFDAITSVRPYGIQLSTELALEELRRGAGRQFDPACVDALAGYLADQPTALAGSFKRFGRTPTALAS